MKNISLMIIILLVLAITVIGCSGLSAKTGHTEIDPLRGSVPESFHFSLQDKDIRNYLSMVNCATFPPDRNLEVSVLGKLADVKSEKELKIVFDHIWNENEHIGTLIWLTLVKKKIPIPASFFYLLKLRSCRHFFKFYCQGRGHHVTTVDQSDIRGLVTA